MPLRLHCPARVICCPLSRWISLLQVRVHCTIPCLGSKVINWADLSTLFSLIGCSTSTTFVSLPTFFVVHHLIWYHSKTVQSRTSPGLPTEFILQRSSQLIMVLIFLPHLWNQCQSSLSSSALKKGWTEVYTFRRQFLFSQSQALHALKLHAYQQSFSAPHISIPSTKPTPVPPDFCIKNQILKVRLWSEATSFPMNSKTQHTRTIFRGLK